MAEWLDVISLGPLGGHAIHSRRASHIKRPHRYQARHAAGNGRWAMDTATYTYHVGILHDGRARGQFSVTQLVRIA